MEHYADPSESVINENATSQEREFSDQETFSVGTPSSMFYLSSKGELNRNSFNIIQDQNKPQGNNIEDLLTRGVDAAQNLEKSFQIPTKKIIRKARTSLRRLSQTCGANPSNNNNEQPSPSRILDATRCERCNELKNSLIESRNRCQELEDELSAYKVLENELKRSLIVTHNELDGMKQLYSGLNQRMVEETDEQSSSIYIDMTLKREAEMARLRFALTESRLQIEELKEANEKLESEKLSMNSTIDAYQESVRTKEELIIKMLNDESDQRHLQQPPQRPRSLAVPVSGFQRHIHQYDDQILSEEEVPEGIPVDFGSSDSRFTQKVFNEVAVVDIDEMKDLLEGYRNQNTFLNSEVIELQKIVQALEEREHNFIRQKFTTEAYYHKLKCQYIMVLNHICSSSSNKLESSEIQQLVDEVRRPQSTRTPSRLDCASYKVEATTAAILASSVSAAVPAVEPNPSISSTSVPITVPSTSPILPPSFCDLTNTSKDNRSSTAPIPITTTTLTANIHSTALAGLFADGHFSQSEDDPEADSLGFYLHSPSARRTVLIAAEAAAASFVSNSEIRHSVNEEATIKNVSPDPLGIPSCGDIFGAESCVAVSMLKNPLPDDSVSPLQVVSASEKAEPQQLNQMAPITSPSALDDNKTIIISLSDSNPHKQQQEMQINQPQNSQTSNGNRRDDSLIMLAADMQRRSDRILANLNAVKDRKYIEWLQNWDSFLVSQMLRKPPVLSPSPELKRLIRGGIPHTHRARVWKCLVDHLVGVTRMETGNGYYDSMVQKAMAISTKPDQQDVLRQIDVDICRTLPNNKYFDSENSFKIKSLRNILYAFSVHNKAITYCQGLNRIGAIGLLYLDEPDAFWFLVACVEYLQPPGYYTIDLAGTLVDQRVLAELVQEKLPNVWNHIRQFEPCDFIPLSVPWFLTIFVDVLSHHVYLNIFDVFLYEGNKVLFRFALAILKYLEPKLLECQSQAAVHFSLSNMPTLVTDFKAIAYIAFNGLNPFSTRVIEMKRQFHYKELAKAKQRDRR